MNLTERTYPVAWEMSDMTMYGRLKRDDDGYLSRWNGFVHPMFSRDEMDRYAAWVLSQPNDELGGDPLYSWVEWDGDTAIVHDPQWPDEEPWRIDPIDGLYDLGGGGWTWQIDERAL